MVAHTACQDLVEDTQEELMENRDAKETEAMTFLEIKKSYYPSELDDVFSIYVQRCFQAPSNYVYRRLNFRLGQDSNCRFPSRTKTRRDLGNFDAF